MHKGMKLRKIRCYNIHKYSLRLHCPLASASRNKTVIDYPMSSDGRR